jgi:DNA-binding transcriptional MocR family regulator
MIEYRHPKERPLYVAIADELEAQIRSGSLPVGERAPSLRAMSRGKRVSITTVQQAYYRLEDRGFLSPRARSGFYVRLPASASAPEPRSATGSTDPATVTVSGLLHSIIHSFAGARLTQLGAATPGPQHLPTERLNLLLRRTARQDPQLGAGYEFPPGNARLRHAIAKRAATYDGDVAAEDVITTVGTMEALNLSLRAVARGGDAVAIESPTYFGILQMIESLSMKAVEVPTHPRLGPDLDSLESAFRRRRVQACILMANCHNPLGYVLPQERKRDLAVLAGKYRVPIIEDDIFGDLDYGPSRPSTVKSFDRTGWVILCSSVSKTLAPGYRVGWVQTQRFRKEIVNLKFVATVATPTLQQLVVAQFLETGGYDRHLSRLRRVLRSQVEHYLDAVIRRFPPGTRITRPQGGYVLWVELPGRIRSLEVYRRALGQGISITPGDVFSARGRFRNHLRLSCGHPCTEEVMGALEEIGQICRSLGRRRAEPG